MLFSSITFLFAFLPVTLVIYYLVPPKMKNVVMLIASLFFYAWGEPVYILLMILSILFNYFSGLDIAQKEEYSEKARRSLIFAVVINLLILGFFKYYGWLMEILNVLFPFEIPYRVLDLPIGLSFYTFQAMSYIIDIYRKEVSPQKNLLHFGLYISLFPQLIAGPIVRYGDMSYDEFKVKSHVVAWRSTARDYPISFENMAMEAGMDDEEIPYLAESALLQNSFS